MSAVRVAVLTVSDTASADETLDKSGPTIVRLLTERGFQCSLSAIVPDSEKEIQLIVKGWVGRGDVDWIVTTGGTGFGIRDRTPETISPLLDRHAPGLVHLLISSSLAHTPLAALSRPVAGMISSTLIVTLPGSVKAVKEGLEALLGPGVINHAVDLIKGGSGKSVHEKLAKEGGDLAATQAHHAGQHQHQHCHHHHHDHDHGHGHQVPVPRTLLSHDPSLPASTRHRHSPYPQITLAQALDLVLNQLKPLETRVLPVTPNLRGHVLAEDVYAPQNVPPVQTTSVDGYAVRSMDVPGVYKVLTSTNHSVQDTVPEGHIYRINTGGPLPAGTDAVIMVEDTRLRSTHPSSDVSQPEEENEVELLVQSPKGDNVRALGSDVRAGDLVLKKGEVLSARGGEVGTLAFVGRQEVEVYKKPKVALLSTGNEIVDIQAQSRSQPQGEWGGIFDTNRPSLQAALEGMGYNVIDLGIVPDTVIAHETALSTGLRDADIILTTGGTSMGPTDLLKPVIERNLGGTIHFGRVSVKPGKPTTFATVGEGEGRKALFALPGNPASALVCFYVFVVPALRRLGGWPIERCQLPRVTVQIQDPMRLDPRPEFHRVIIRASQELRAYSTGGQRSSRMSSLSGANGLVALPAKEEAGREMVGKGETVEALVIGEILSGL